jgi:hypothetical protein
MLRLSILAIALLIDLAVSADAQTSGCAQVSNLSTVRLYWAAVRKGYVDPAHNEENYRSYATNFFEAVTARQAASFCKDGIDRERILESLDFEIEADRDSVQPVMTCMRFICTRVTITRSNAALIYVKAPIAGRGHEKAREMSAIPTDQEGRTGMPDGRRHCASEREA